MDKIDSLKLKYRKAQYKAGQAGLWLKTVSEPKRNLEQAEIQIVGFLFILFTQNCGERKLSQKERYLIRKIFKTFTIYNIILEDCKRVIGPLNGRIKYAYSNKQSIQCCRKKIIGEIHALVTSSGNLRRLFKSCENVYVSPESIRDWLSYYESMLIQYRQALPFITKARESYRRAKCNASIIFTALNEEKQRLRDIHALEKKKKKEEQKDERQNSKATSKKPETGTKTTLIDGQYKGRVF